MSLAVVTGAGSGIGAALSHCLASRGFDVLLVGRSRRVEDNAKAIRKRAQGIEVISERAELAEPASRGALIERIQDIATARAKPVHALVHAAGVGVPSRHLESMAPTELEHAFRVNVTAALALTQGLLPQRRTGDSRSRILFIGAGIDERPQPGTGSYGISKLALKRLWRQIPLDLAQQGMAQPPLVGLFQPGVVDTPGLRDHIEAAHACALPHADYLQSILDQGGAYGPEAVGEAIATLLADVAPEAFAEREWRTGELTPWVQR